MDIIYYCGFNGFKQVPSCNSHTINSFVQQTVQRSNVLDIAICWNYLVTLDDQNGITKFGLVNNKNVRDRIPNPPGSGGKVVQISATPRHILACTENGECWTHEDSKGWRKIHVGAEGEESSSGQDGDEEGKEDEEERHVESAKPQENVGDESKRDEIVMVKTACGDSHNLGLDNAGRAYSLPSPLNLEGFPPNVTHKVTDIACGKEHSILLTEHGQVFTWGGGSRGQLGHGTLTSEEHPRLVSALDGMKIKKIAAGGWHTAVISQFDDLYMFGWNESGQLAQTTNLSHPAECFATVEKLLMACCTMQPEDSENPRGDSEDCEVYHKPDDEASTVEGGECAGLNHQEIEKDVLTCYSSTSCNNANSTDVVIVQPIPMLVSLPHEAKVINVACGSRHTIVLTEGNQLWSFGWNKYGQLGLGHTLHKDSVQRINLPKSISRNSKVKMLSCGDWGTVLVTTAEPSTKKS